MFSRNTLLLPLLPALWLPPMALALWSPEPADPQVIELVSAFGAEVEDSTFATGREGYLLPAQPVQDDQFGLSPSLDGVGQVSEVIRTPELPEQGGEAFSRVDVAKVKAADARAAQRRSAADALLTGVSIPEPAVLSLLAVGLLVLAVMSRPQRDWGWRRIFSSRDSASERTPKSSPDASKPDNSRSAS